MPAFVTRLCALSITAAALCCAADAVAIPITYSFTTANDRAATAVNIDLSVPRLNGPNAAVAAFFTGLTINGSFVYDSDSAVSSVLTGPTGTQNVYDTAITNLVGTIGDLNFSDTAGLTQLAEDTLLLPVIFPSDPVTRDFLQISASSTGFSGFTLDSFGLTLLSARLFWIEGNEGAIGETLGDFLTTETLPAALPSEIGLFGLTFGQIGSSSAFTTVNFYGLSVTPVSVPEPGTLTLLALGGLVTLGLRRRRSRLS